MSEALILEKLDAILRALNQPETPSGGIEPPDVPELPLSMIPPESIDGVTIQPDGSVWSIDVRTGRPVREIYGYISQRKNPAMWDRMAALLGENRLVATLAVGGPWARYKTHPDSVCLGADPQAVTLGYVLSQPILPFRHSVG